jgi:hypothetical protein
MRKSPRSKASAFDFEFSDNLIWKTWLLPHHGTQES